MKTYGLLAGIRRELSSDDWLSVYLHVKALRTGWLRFRYTKMEIFTFSLKIILASSRTTEPILGLFVLI